MVCVVATFLSPLDTKHWFGSPVCWFAGGIKRRAYLTCFVSVLVMAHSGPRKLTLAAFICNSDDTENYTRHTNLT